MRNFICSQISVYVLFLTHRFFSYFWNQVMRPSMKHPGSLARQKIPSWKIVFHFLTWFDSLIIFINFRTWSYSVEFTSLLSSVIDSLRSLIPFIHTSFDRLFLCHTPCEASFLYGMFFQLFASYCWAISYS